ncbi:NADP-dependent malic enzyme [Amorphus orientalis]|uniref:Malate dehydrogenase (Oxaloacetate-decarboxylating)(NADP+) n=1 Tax=Amorphus orientalis TaxID=649198 RepID=A0AAE3VSA1_9HYPH|nr:NADP-dependent malic enzyme [Amorphus orientalis]MDQ0317257.1 malate dehydrogenase (oxaloacetate-decarboxylating)(NADP+) [Amorphus orientalis]
MSQMKPSSETLDDAALRYHQNPLPGKLEIQATKPLATQRDLSLAYSPGVAAPCLKIAEDPTLALDYTARGNLVAVISNGTAVLGLGSIGALAGKPVMEGKAVLFKKFANVDVFDIEVEERDVDKFCDVVAALEPTFGGINLEDIKGPDCFEIEDQLKARMNIPVFHDDQHGTAIIVSAAVTNALSLSGKKIEDVKIVCSGAGAAALACLNLLVSLGADRKNIWVCDIDGVVYEGREASMDRWKSVYAQATDKRTLGEVIDGADIFLGLSVGGLLKPEMVTRMADHPLVLALANPTPEIMPDLAREARPDALICTGRSDYPNQVNNVLCFPYLFRGALDVGATAINEDMKRAAVQAIADLAKEEPSEVVAKAYGGVTRTFGPDYLIPSPFDPRLILRIAPAVARAAMDSGVAVRPIEDFDAYRDRLNRFVFKTGVLMKPIFAEAKTKTQRIVYAEGEDERVLRAAQVIQEEGLAEPILIGRPKVIESRAERYGLRLVPGKTIEVINPEDDPRFRDYSDLYFSLVGRDGVTPDAARTAVRSNTAVIGALAVKRGDADALICGVESRFDSLFKDIRSIIGCAPGVESMAALSILMGQSGTYYLVDTAVSEDPTAEEIAEMTKLAARQVRRFGVTPKAALLSHSSFGSRDSASARKMRKAAEILWRTEPDLEVDGEMKGDEALSEMIRSRSMPDGRLSGEANLMVFPNLDSANIALTLIKEMTQALHIGPLLLGAAQPAYIVARSTTARGVVNMTAVAAVEAANRAAAAKGRVPADD